MSESERVPAPSFPHPPCPGGGYPGQRLENVCGQNVANAPFRGPQGRGARGIVRKEQCGCTCGGGGRDSGWRRQWAGSGVAGITIAAGFCWFSPGTWSSRNGRGQKPCRLPSVDTSTVFTAPVAPTTTSVSKSCTRLRVQSPKTPAHTVRSGANHAPHNGRTIKQYW